MKYVVLSLFWAFGLTSFAQFLSVDPASADIFDGETTAKVLNVRSGPGTQHHVVTAVPDGTRVSILEIDNGWARISARGENGLVDGWVSGKYLELYEIALPEVASAGIEDEIEDKLSGLSQPAEESEVAAETATEQSVAVVTDNGITPKDLTSVKGVPTEASDLVGPDKFPEEITVAEPVTAPEPEPAKVATAEQVVAPEPEPAKVAIAEQVVAPKPEPAKAAIAEQVVALKPEPAEIAEVQTSNILEELPTQPALSDAVEEQKLNEPLTYEPLDITCRRGYFSDALEACVADIKVDVSVPEDFAGLFTDKITVRCDVGFLYEAGGESLTETESEVLEIDLKDGKGTAVLESRIDFLHRLDDVTRVEIGEISCGGVN